MKSCPIEFDQLSVLILTLVDEVDEPLLHVSRSEVAAMPFESDVLRDSVLFRPIVSPAFGERERVGD